MAGQGRSPRSAVGARSARVQVVEWTTLGFGPADGGYASIFFGWTAFQLLFALGALFWLENILATSLRYRNIRRRLRPGHASGDPGRPGHDIADPLALVSPGLEAVSFYWWFLAGLGVTRLDHSSTSSRDAHRAAVLRCRRRGAPLLARRPPSRLGAAADAHSGIRARRCSRSSWRSTRPSTCSPISSSSRTWCSTCCYQRRAAAVRPLGAVDAALAAAAARLAAVGRAQRSSSARARGRSAGSAHALAHPCAHGRSRRDARPLARAGALRPDAAQRRRPPARALPLLRDGVALLGARLRLAAVPHAASATARARHRHRRQCSSAGCSRSSSRSPGRRVYAPMRRSPIGPAAFRRSPTSARRRRHVGARLARLLDRDRRLRVPLARARARARAAAERSPH